MRGLSLIALLMTTSNKFGGAMHKKVIFPLLSLVMVSSLLGCKSTTVTVIEPAPVYAYTTTTTTTTQPSTTSAQTTIATASNEVLSGGSFSRLPSNGVCLQSGTNLKLSWAGDGYLEAFIFTETQYNNFKFAGIPSAYLAYGSGSSGSINANVQNYDKYYAVVANRGVLASDVKLYQATLVLR
jgi:hypothetical protein